MIRLNNAQTYKKIFYSLNTLFYLHLGFIGAIYTVFFYNQGIDKLQTNILSSIFTICVFIMEIPTGAYADVFGTRKSLLLGGFTLLMAMLGFTIGTNIGWFIFAQALWGVSFTFISGALDAWIINKLNLKGVERDIVFTKVNKIGNIASIICGFIGGFAFNLDNKLPWTLSVISSILYIIITFLFIEDINEQNKVKINFREGVLSLKSIIKSSFQWLTTNSILRSIILLNMSIAFSFSPIFTFWSPYLDDLFKNGNWILGFVWVFIKTGNFVGNSILQWWLKFEKNKIKIMKICIIVISIEIFLASMLKYFILVLILFIGFEVLLGVIQPVQRSFINEYIPDSQRSTLLSFNSMASKLTNFISLIIMGFLADRTSISFTWLLTSIFIFSNLFLLHYLGKSEGKNIF